jgi:polyisoprenoid-binding protein YceI
MSQKTTWAIDPAHTDIAFKVKHMMFTNVTGKILKYEAKIVTDGDDFDNATIEFTGQTSSISTANADRDAHLLSPDFFDADRFPEIHFRATSFKKTDIANFHLLGDLTMHGVTKPVSLQVEYGGLMKDPFNNLKASLLITGTINRKNWGLNWNAALEAGGVLVGDDVRISADVQLIKHVMGELQLT